MLLLIVIVNIGFNGYTAYMNQEIFKEKKQYMEKSYVKEKNIEVKKEYKEKIKYTNSKGIYFNNRDITKKVYKKDNSRALENRIKMIEAENIKMKQELQKEKELREAMLAVE